MKVLPPSALIAALALVLNAILWTAKGEIPADGVPSKVSAEELAANLDPKGKK